ncbi:hypothetical protein HZH66_007182 [Vespula vulgaris]|uniref:Uncharacterized protein n=1 Tax=Vespula vulgaris TaxID=7454 RepID=A0A834N5B5_VESVU|nr:hypothetical protein HZH66_007182 [Vespula vulgaris]
MEEKEEEEEKKKKKKEEEEKKDRRTTTSFFDERNREQKERHGSVNTILPDGPANSLELRILAWPGLSPGHGFIIILIHVNEDARNLTYRTMTFRTGYVRGPCPFQFRQSSPYGHDELVSQVFMKKDEDKSRQRLQQQ